VREFVLAKPERDLAAHAYILCFSRSYLYGHRDANTERKRYYGDSEFYKQPVRHECSDYWHSQLECEYSDHRRRSSGHADWDYQFRIFIDVG
jgi:hypothetical protein